MSLRKISDAPLAQRLVAPVKITVICTRWAYLAVAREQDVADVGSQLRQEGIEMLGLHRSRHPPEYPFKAFDRRLRIRFWLAYLYRLLITPHLAHDALDLLHLPADLGLLLFGQMVVVDDDLYNHDFPINEIQASRSCPFWDSQSF